MSDDHEWIEYQCEILEEEHKEDLLIAGKYRDILLDKIKTLTGEVDKHRWIPVSERLPDEDCLVIAATWLKRDGTQTVEIESFRKGGEYFSKDTVTHWMPLPLPPETSIGG